MLKPGIPGKVRAWRGALAARAAKLEMMAAEVRILMVIKIKEVLKSDCSGYREWV
jgi:hypothetical protein